MAVKFGSFRRSFLSNESFSMFRSTSLWFVCSEVINVVSTSSKTLVFRENNSFAIDFIQTDARAERCRHSLLAHRSLETKFLRVHRNSMKKLLLLLRKLEWNRLARLKYETKRKGRNQKKTFVFSLREKDVSKCPLCQYTWTTKANVVIEMLLLLLLLGRVILAWKDEENWV